jgi:hypothetical protein
MAAAAHPSHMPAARTPLFGARKRAFLPRVRNSMAITFVLKNLALHLLGASRAHPRKSAERR